MMPQEVLQEMPTQEATTQEPSSELPPEVEVVIPEVIDVFSEYGIAEEQDIDEGFRQLQEEFPIICGKTLKLTLNCISDWTRDRVPVWLHNSKYRDENFIATEPAELWLAMKSNKDRSIHRIEEINGEPQVIPNFDGEIVYMYTVQFKFVCD
jgi:hypothetical protein